MKPELRIGVVDSGHSAAQRVQVIAGRRFSLLEDGLAESDLRDDPLGHGSAVIEAISRRAPVAQMCVAQVFDQRGVTSALQISAAIDWLVAQDVRLINLSLGLRQDRSLLREACAAAVARGVLLCASSPAQGAAVFPASYPQVLRVTGDARCTDEQWSWLDSAQADFAACVHGTYPGQSGASLGCAALSGHIAGYLLEHPQASNAEVIDWLKQHARYRGPERRFGP
ncbi:peptidase S8 and S53 subtilisin kexin sedolisin [Pseudomonas sp. FW215-R2]|uniref:subtilisin-like serine protease QhpE n=1 Tax=unclassified Pseudomonas TaxID=196821 RepID=UPI000C8818E2|nr:MULTISPECIES: S8 family serine peptidase [unclassified Pseudomonas]PMW96781.1 peptidase S8 and S53 subtilisin kexin sedolisin [Pseudomonas sp. FW215-R2]PMX07103.1 peptidase S8 and S53 subtilisin kexin sedolisin [Pseudomonas sp. FW215-L1]PMX20132.1 peptidase S8 and S53 subtilisin kexin sedolisin [Pseudomonas sp. FW215-E1]PNA26033.1 peptidase S8 and S53 subtilisin kexin sedolisin [Pseudomonas sp. FW215-R4]